jgi:6-phosphogluconolactonase
MVLIYSDPEELAVAAAAMFVANAQDALRDRGAFHVALSGGSTPSRMYRVLVDRYAEALDWARVRFYWSDDRYVPASDPGSNEGTARRELLGPLRIPEANIHPFFADGGPGHAAAAYDALLRDVTLDLCLLGLGGDGHTASLFPGDPSVRETERLAVASKAPVGVADRLTLTPRGINGSRQVMFLAGCEDKADAVERVFRGPEDWDETPAQAVARHAPSVAWLLDRAAAQRIG